MNKIINLKNVTIIVTLIVMFIFLVGTIYDYEITNFLYGRVENITTLTEILGEVPFGIVTGTGLLLMYKVHQNKYVKALSLILLFYVIMYIYKCIIEMIYDLNNIHINIMYYIIVILLSLITVVISVLLINKLQLNKTHNLKKKALILIVYPVVIVLVVQLIKYGFGRPRYYAIIDGTYDFQQWYMITGIAIDDARHSFVSAHTATASLIMTLVILFEKKTHKIYFSIFSLIIIILTAFSRMFSGDHFITDIAGGFYITFIGLVIIIYIQRRNNG